MNADEDRLDSEGCGGNAAPYVLGALTDDESEAFRRHMDSCAVCREEVAALQVVVAALPAAAPQVIAPGDLKRRVMAEVRADARRLPEREPGRAPRPRGTGRLRRRPAFAGLAAAAVVIALALIAFASGGGSGGARVIRAQVLAPGATALLRLSDGHADLRIANMPQTSPGRVYEVWLKGSGRPRPTDVLFTVTSRGDATVGVPGVVHGVEDVLVTSEPLGGSRVPTRTPVIVARVS
ncbi:MAG TPA: anti-sigma factor [Solirubrobacteraceae bacterium]|nr:anti-sigma factor [Solirubrobacteraceae bacterium]